MGKSARRSSLRIVLGVFAAMAAASASSAADFDAFDLHGYGTQTYAQTNGNAYIDADQKGTWDNNILALVGTVALGDKTKLWAQLETSSLEATRFSWFFLDFQLTDDSTVHVGRVKFPLGVYNETIDAKFLQQSSLEPAVYQQAADFVHDAYTGVGYDHVQHLGDAGKITWQIYGGNAYDTDPPVASRDRRIYGARVTYATPIDGLRFLLSGYRTQVQILATDSLINETRWIASVDYVNSDWDLKSEYGGHKFGSIDSDAYYVQVGRTFATRWTVFGRYDSVIMDKSQTSSDSFSQKILVAGLNFKVRSNVSLRVENQFNRGYALPVASGEVQQGLGKHNWNLLIVGLHFIF